MPTSSVGDAHGAIAKPAVGSDTSPGTNAISITGTATISGATTISGNLVAQSGITIAKGTASCRAADNGGTGIIYKQLILVQVLFVCWNWICNWSVLHILPF